MEFDLSSTRDCSRPRVARFLVSLAKVIKVFAEKVTKLVYFTFGESYLLKKWVFSITIDLNWDCKRDFGKNFVLLKSHPFEV